MKRSRVRKRSLTKPIFGIVGIGSAALFSTAAVASALSLVYAALNMPDSLVAKWLVRPLAIAGAATVGTGGGLPNSVGSTTSVTTPPASSSIRPTRIGQNLDPGDYWTRNRIFMNLAAGEGWQVTPAAGGSTDSYFDADHNVIKILPGDTVGRMVMRPSGLYAGKSVDVVCRWDGVGTLYFVRPNGIRTVTQTANSARYTHFYVADNDGWMPVYMGSVDPANPIRNFDCREADADRSQLFEPAYLANVKRFSSVRFMDWQQINKNLPVTWAKRTTPASQTYGKADGYAIEHMIELANQAHVDPWFCMPWNADDDYVRKFAQMVRDKLDPSLVAYIETSNEVWNWMFPVTGQAYAEGLARNLSADGGQAQQYRYAEKLGQQMDIWKDVFTGQMHRIVRVAANQNANDWTIRQTLEFRDTATKIDAIASAPYFEDNNLGGYSESADLAPFFATLKTMLDTRFEAAKRYKALADQYKLRYITYEGGQHVTGGSAAMQYRVQHDPRMGQLYTYYLTRWNREIGDQMTLLSDIGGAWALLDYVGQSPNATPKAKAVDLFMASIGKPE